MTSKLQEIKLVTALPIRNLFKFFQAVISVTYLICHSDLDIIYYFSFLIAKYATKKVDRKESTTSKDKTK